MFPNGDKDAPDRYIQQISVTIGNYSAEYRRAIDTSMAAVNNGTGYGDDGPSSILVAILYECADSGE